MISLVIPVYNEQESLALLHGEIAAVAAREGLSVEVVFVDDGSRDGSWAVIRGLARACHLDLLNGVPAPSVRPELLQAATWRAARYGVDGELLDVLERRSLPAGKMVAAILDFVGPALDEFGEREEVSGLVDATLREGTGDDVWRWH